MMQIIAEHLKESVYPNFLLLGDYIVIDKLKLEIELKGVGDNHYIYHKTNNGEIVIKDNEEYIKLVMYQCCLVINILSKTYLFEDGIMKSYKDNWMEIFMETHGEVSSINFRSGARVIFNIQDLSFYIDPMNTSLNIEKLSSTLYDEDEFYYPDDEYKYKLYQYGGNLNLLIMNEKQYIDSMNEIIINLDFIKNNPFTDHLFNL